ncbi:MAG: trypsin-like peptidase domain-containing protein [Zavarzinella sp.]
MPYFVERYPADRDRSAPWSLVIGMLFLVGVAAFLIWYFALKPDRNQLLNPNAQPRQVVPASDPDAQEMQRITVFQKTYGSVVNVDTLRLQRLGRTGLAERAQGTGSGFMWDEAGRIVTNFHVIKDALAINNDNQVVIQDSATIRITLSDRTAWNARLVGIAPDSDLAVLQITVPESKIKPLPLGTSADLQVGQTVYAIGNPFGQSLTFTAGMISALDREIESSTDRPITGVIQTDASLNPGNSGGPLLDRDGRLIGVNTAITSPNGGSVGIGYAIPVDLVNTVVTELIRTGRQARPALGVVLLPDREMQQLRLERGVMIAQVYPNSAAAKAGLRGILQDQVSGKIELGDILIGADGVEFKEKQEFLDFMRRVNIGQEVTFDVIRAGEQIQVKVRLEGI